MVYETDEMTHHGIKGMRWGVRRTPAQLGHKTSPKKKRTPSKLELAYKEHRARKKEVKANKKLMKKDISDMTDDELMTAIRRKQIENQYEALHPQKASVGKRFVGALGSNVIAPAATAAGKRFLENALNKLGDNLLKDAIDPDSIEALTKQRDKLKLKDEIDRMKNPDKHLSWQDRLNEQKYRFNEEDRAARKAKKEAEKAAKKEAKKESKKESKGDGPAGLLPAAKKQEAPKNEAKKETSRKSDNDKEVYDGPIEVFPGEGSSRSSKKSRSKSNNDPGIYYASFTDVTDRYSSRGQEAASGILNRSSTPVASLPPASSSSRSSSFSGDTPVASLPPASSSKSLVDNILDQYYR